MPWPNKPLLHKSLFCTTLRVFVGLILPLLFSVSCEFIRPKEVIPSYIQIDSMPFVRRASAGYGSQNIEDVWVYANDQIIGTFTLPTKPIPILAEGDVKISVSAGVFTDAVKGLKVYYPFFQQYTETVKLVQGKVTPIKPIAQYPTDLNIPFKWYQDFERSDTGYVKEGSGLAPVVRKAHSADTDTARYGSYFAQIASTGSTEVLAFTMDRFVPLKQTGLPLYLELDYKSTTNLSVGVYGWKGGTKSPLVYDLVLLPSDSWTKVYVSLTDEIQNFTQGNTFQFDIRSTTQPGPGHSFSVDNLKLIQY